MTAPAARANPWWTIPTAAEWACLGIVCVVVAALLARLAAGVALVPELLLHLALLTAHGATIAVLARFEPAEWSRIGRAFLVVGVMFTLYMTLARVPFVAMPWVADPALARLDRGLFLGASPNLWLDARLTSRSVELLSFAYGLFVPFLYLTILVGVLGRRQEEREELVTGLALLYATSFLGYLFLPARGPIVELSFPAALDGGRFHALVVDAIDRCGGPHGAFPSLHVGVTLYAVAFDLARNRLRGLVYLPLAALIPVAAVALRYHYVVDLVAGAVLAWGAARLRRPVLERYRLAGGA